MLVFIGNLPGDTHLQEIQEIVGDRDMLVDYKTYRARPADNQDYHFVLAKTDSKDSAAALIRKLNGTAFRGVEIEARHFVKRKKLAAWQGVERRGNQLDFDFE